MSTFVRPATVLISLSLLSPIPSAIAQARDKPVQININAGSLADALGTLSDQSGMQIMYEPALTAGIMVSGVSGRLTVGDALTRVLLKSGLRADRVNDTTVVIKRAEATKVAVKTESESPALSLASLEASAGLDEVTVTAEKHEERLQDTPVPVSVINTVQLTNTDQVLLRDYFTSVPGLSVTPNLIVAQIIAIRGISTGDYTAPTVAVMIDGLPQNSSLPTTSAIVPDIDPFDLARIEVLRGPQGTLYGANSLGGLVNYITIDPSTDGFSARVAAGTSSVRNGAKLGYNFRAAANVPISDTLAIRVSGYGRQDPGYIDNIVTGRNGVNETHAEGARLAGLWRPSSDFSVRFSALYQYTYIDGKSEVVRGPGLGDLQQNYAPGTGGTRQEAGAYSLVFNYKIGSVDMTSSTGYNFNHTFDTFDITSLYGSSAQSLFNVPQAAYPEGDTTRKVTQELRFSGSPWQSLDWLAGLFYSHDRNSNWDSIYAIDPTGQHVGLIQNDSSPTFTYTEYAAFGDLTYHFTDQFDVQVGGRETHEKTFFGASASYGALIGPAPAYFPSAAASANAFTYLLSPRFKVSPDLMVYARLASGYRPGGPNFRQSVSNGAPASYQPDKTYNYEVGAKGDFLDQLLSFDASIYYINWKGIQLQLDTPLYYGYYTNGSDAKSEGAELSITTRPLTGLTITAWGTYDKAVLTREFPSNSTVLGAPGDRLPTSPRVSWNVAAQQEFPLWSAATGFVGGQFSYVGDREGMFVAAPPRQTYPSYTKTDLRAGARFDSWEATVYANNVADVRGVLNSVDFFPSEFILIQPRTIGFNVSKKF